MQIGKQSEVGHGRWRRGVQIGLTIGMFLAALIAHSAVGLQGWRVVYESLAVFGFGGDLSVGAGSPWLWAVWVVRCGAPLALTVAVLDAVWSTLRELVVPTMDVVPADWSGHAVVIGAGRIGKHLCRVLGEKEGRVAAIEHDPAAPAIEQLRSAGVPVIVGDARDKDVLARAGVTRAAELYAVARDDMVNLSAALISMSLAAAEGNKDLLGFAQITDGRLDEEIEGRLSTEYGGRLEAFSSYDIAAGALMENCPPELKRRPGEDFERGLIVIAGFGRFGQATLGAILAGTWDVDEHPRVVVLDTKAIGPQDWWREYLPKRTASGIEPDEGWSVEAKQLDIRGPALEAELRAQGETPGPMWFLICTDDDNANLSLALRVARMGLSPRIHLFTRMFQWPPELSGAGFEGIRAVNLSDWVNKKLPGLIEEARERHRRPEPIDGGADDQPQL